MRTGIETLTVLLSFLAVLLATSAANAQVVHACAHKQTGVLRLVADPSACGPNEPAVSWNQEGPKGDMGDPGEPGPQGSPGSTLRVLDATGAEVGIYVSSLDTSTTLNAEFWRVIDESTGVMFVVQVVNGRLKLPIRTPRFDTYDCSGTMYLSKQEIALNLLKIGDGLFAVVEPTLPVSVDIVALRDHSGRCVGSNQGVWLMSAAREFRLDELGLSFPLPTPLSLSLE